MTTMWITVIGDHAGADGGHNADAQVVEKPGEISFVHGMHHFTHSVHPISAFIYCINSLWFIKSISIFKSRWIYKIHPYLQIQVGNSRHWLSAEGKKSPKIALYQRLQACNCCCSIFDVIALYQRLKACNYISPFLRFLPSMPVLYMCIVQKKKQRYFTLCRRRACCKGCLVLEPLSQSTHLPSSQGNQNGDKKPKQNALRGTTAEL